MVIDFETTFYFHREGPGLLMGMSDPEETPGFKLNRSDAWLPGLNEPPYCPTIVGAAALVSPQQSFGTFAVQPDHTALGVQAANILFDLADNNWTLAPDVQVQLPLSTTTTLDFVQVRSRFSLRADALQHVDRILE